MDVDLILNKTDHIFIQLLTCVMLDRLSDVDHYISDSVYQYYSNFIEDMKKDSYRKMYDELNVKTSSVESIDLVNNYYVIRVNLIARYKDYIIDLNTGNLISGNDRERIEVNYKLEFIRKINVKDDSLVRRCPNCGHGLDVSLSGKCSYCGSIYNQEDYDLVLTKIEVV